MGLCRKTACDERLIIRCSSKRPSHCGQMGARRRHPRTHSPRGALVSCRRLPAKPPPRVPDSTASTRMGRVKFVLARGEAVTLPMIPTCHIPRFGFRNPSFSVARQASIGTPVSLATMSIASFTYVQPYRMYLVIYVYLVIYIFFGELFTGKHSPWLPACQMLPSLQPLDC